MSTQYTINIQDHNSGLDQSFELKNHKWALALVKTSLTMYMEITVVKTKTSKDGQEITIFPVTSSDLPKYVQDKVKHLVPFANHIQHLHLAVQANTGTCTLYVFEPVTGWMKTQYNSPNPVKEINSLHEYTEGVCGSIKYLLAERPELTFKVIPNYTDEQIDEMIQNKTLPKVAWCSELYCPWDNSPAKEEVQEDIQEEVTAAQSYGLTVIGYESLCEMWYDSKHDGWDVPDLDTFIKENKDTTWYPKTEADLEELYGPAGVEETMLKETQEEVQEDIQEDIQDDDLEEVQDLIINLTERIFPGAFQAKVFVQSCPQCNWEDDQEYRRRVKGYVCTECNTSLIYISKGLKWFVEV